MLPAAESGSTTDYQKKTTNDRQIIHEARSLFTSSSWVVDRPEILEQDCRNDRKYEEQYSTIARKDVEKHHAAADKHHRNPGGENKVWRGRFARAQPSRVEIKPSDRANRLKKEEKRDQYSAPGVDQIIIHGGGWMLACQLARTRRSAAGSRFF